MRRFRSIRLSGCAPLLALVLFALALPGWSQAPAPSDDKTVVPTDFRSLSNERTQLQGDIHDAQQRVDALTKELGLIQVASQQINIVNGMLKDDKDPVKTKFDNQTLQGWRNIMATYRAVEVVQSDLARAQAEAATNQKRLSELEARIGAALDVEKPRQVFKTDLSIAFSLLIGAVILGFYWMAWKDSKVRASIFSGDAGLQFITLFSLVIAIILFGLTEVLGGRELAALLGGISGYILGRSSTHAKGNEAAVQKSGANAHDKLPTPAGDSDT